jgi:PKD repeat protein
MRTKLYFPIIFVLLIIGSPIDVFSQSVRPDRVINPVAFDKSQKLSNVNVIPLIPRDRSWKDGVLPYEDDFNEKFSNPASSNGPDPVLQGEMRGTTTAATVLNEFEGVPIQCGAGWCWGVPDTNGDVGPNHYMQMVNAAFQIFDKNGNSLYGPADNSTLWDGFIGPWTGTNDGYSIVLYDEYADRWIASQRARPSSEGPFYELIAVSETGDPTGAWYRYAYEFVNSPTKTKMGVWNDSYYFTTNMHTPATGNGTFVESAVCVLDRTAMIAGDPTAQMIMFTTPYSFILPSDADGATPPPSGSPAYMMCLEADHLRMWEVNVDWGTPSNSSMTHTTSLYMEPYSKPGRLSQPGTTTTLQSESYLINYRLQYRNFGTHEVLLTNHTVDADGTGRPGIRWYEMRNTGNGWEIYQQGTFAPADGDGRWMGSMAMNGDGDIAVGYSVSGNSTYPSIRVAGQKASNSGTGVLDVNETSVFEGYASHTEWPDWGNISMMAVDPGDDSTFWYTNEYSNGGFAWRTRIASFTLPPYCISNGNSTEREWIQKIDLGNYTNNSGDNGGYLDKTTDPISIESGQTYAFTGTPGFSNRSRREFWRVWIDFNGDDDFTDSGEEVFAADAKKGPVNGSISIPSGLTGDTWMRVSMKYNAAPNPCEQFDYGEVEDYILRFTEPVPLPPIADFEGTPTTVTEGNSVDFTDLSQNNPTSWAWTFEGGTPASSSEQNPIVTYDTEGTYQVSLTATNAEGSDTKTVAGYITVNPVGTTTYCSSSSQSNDQEWIAQIDIDGFSNPSGASLYSDFTGLTVGLLPGSSSNVNLIPGYSGSSQREFWRIWIDFNNDGDFDDSGEMVFAANNKKNGVSGTISIPSSATGQTRMRISMKNGGAPDPCEIFPDGEVEDYTVSFMASAPLGISQFNTRDLKIFPNPSNGRFHVQLGSDIFSEARLRVYDIKGMLLRDLPVFMPNFELDLSDLDVGIYMIHILNGNEYYHSKLVKK